MLALAILREQPWRDRLPAVDVGDVGIDRRAGER